MENSNVQDPEELKIDFAVDTGKVTKQLYRNFLKAEVERLTKIARFWAVPVEFIMADKKAQALSCHTCYFKIFLHTKETGCFATKLVSTPLSIMKLPTRFIDGKTPHEKPAWCPLHRIHITIDDRT